MDCTSSFGSQIDNQVGVFLFERPVIFVKVAVAPFFFESAKMASDKGILSGLFLRRKLCCLNG